MAASNNLRALPATAYLLAAAVGLLVAVAYARVEHSLSPVYWRHLLAVLLSGVGLGLLSLRLYAEALQQTSGISHRRAARRRQRELLAQMRRLEEEAPEAADESGDSRQAAQLGVLHLLLGHGTEGVQFFKRANPHGDDATILNNVGVALLVQERSERALQALQAAAHLAPEEPAIRLNLCLHYRSQRKVGAAIKQFRQVAALASDRRWQHLHAELELRDGRPLVAGAMLRELLDANPRDAAAWNTMGVAMAVAGEYNGAEEAFRKALRLHYGCGAAHANLGLAAYRKGRRKLALRRLQRAARLAPGEAYIRLNIGAVCHLLGRYEASKTALREAMQLAPEAFEPHLNMAEALLDQGRQDEALLAAEQSLRLEPGSGPGQLAYGAACFALHRFDDAIAEFEAARSDPLTSDLADHNIGLAYAVSGRIDPALEALHRALEQAPADLRHREALAYVHHLNGDLVEAHQLYQSLVLVERGAPVLYHLGLCDYAAKRYETAIEWFEEALAVNPAQHECFFPLGCAYAAQGLGDQAREYWEKGLQHEPGSPELLCNLGLAYYQKKQTDAALAMLRRAYFARSDDPYFNNNLALAYCQGGRYDRAAEFFENCADLMPDSVVARCNLGLAFYLSGLVDSALEQWTIAAQVNPTYYQQRRSTDLQNTFDETYLRPLDVDWRARALPQRPVTVGFLTRHLTPMPELPWQILAPPALGFTPEQAARWSTAAAALVTPQEPASDAPGAAAES